ncbi:UDP-N-acetylglucosamine 1-carboxyvinyltransferase [Nocardiopsis rhodophaea]
MRMGQQVRYRVRGGRSLKGTAFIQGAKNAVLPMIGAALLASEGRTVLRNVPIIEDVRRALELAEHIGAKVEFHEPERTIVIDASELGDPERAVLPADIAARFRGSVLFVPALMHRMGQARIEGVGGCNLGSRKLDFHYRGFARLGAEVTEDAERNHINITASNLRGGPLYLDTPSHTGTENLIMAAVLTPGTTVIEHAALEPEVLDVIEFLTRMGAKISGGGTGIITVEGVASLTAVEHTIMSDRIDAGVLAMMAAATGGEVSLVGAHLDHLGVARWKLEQMGVEFAQQGAVLHVRRDADAPLRPINAVTSPYPGFATDLQSPLMALATLADGESYLHEAIYDGRFALADELNKMGAKIEVDGTRAIVHGSPSTQLRGTDVVAHDLRTGAALVLAGLVAEGETVVASGYLVDRGHSQFASRLAALGADVTRESAA